MAMIPVARTLANWSSEVFFTRPFLVEKKTFLPLVSRGTGINADSDSPSLRLNKLTIERPFEARPPSGSS